ncbi:MAG: class D sortase [Gammaproteobacteria bacterium]|nr:class D sortase [Gammaproteobacteria bacterium]
MAGNKALKRKLGWLEAALYLAGVVLIAVFAFLRSDAERSREEGLESFERNVAQSAPADLGSQSGDADQRPGRLPSSLPGDVSPGALLPAPNQELWDEQRIRAYQETSEAATDVPLAVLRIDPLGLAVPVYDGADDFNLNRGAGRIRGTARIDTDGNLGIAAHRDSFFRPLKDIEVGDTVILKTAGGTVTYAVSSLEIVEPDDVSVLATTAEKTLTLVTCYPFYYVGQAPKRFIVKAVAEHPLAKT